MQVSCGKRITALVAGAALLAPVLAAPGNSELSGASDGYKDRATVVNDPGGVKTEIAVHEGPRSAAAGAPGNGASLHALIDKQSGAVTYQVAMTTYYLGKAFKFFRTAYFQTDQGAASSPVRLLSRSMKDCDPYGKCAYQESGGFAIDENILRRIVKDYSASSGDYPPWRFRLEAKSGAQSDGYLPGAEVAGFMARVDEYFADSGLTPSRAKVDDRPSLSPLKTMADFGVQAAGKSELAPVLAASLGKTELKGVLIVTVAAGSIADKSGLKAGDDLFQFDGMPVADARQMNLAVAAAAVGATIPVKVMRNGSAVSLTARF